jgi:FkbM family methyltransferase
VTPAFSLDDYRLHNSARLEGRGPVVVSTPADRWAYAVEFPRSASAALGSTPVSVTVELTVLEGTIGIGCAGHDGAFIVERERSPADGATRVDFTLPSLDVCRSLIVRNTSPAHGASTVLIGAITTRPVPPEALAPPAIHLDVSVFDGFTPWSGVTAPGWLTDWLGTRTRAEVLSEWDQRPIVHTERHESPGVPLACRETVEWVSLFQALHAAGETFVVAELGAGWGPWLAAGALAARRTGRAYRLIGVEPEPTHFRWLRRHLDDNGIDPGRCRLIQAAVSTHAGACWLLVGDPQAWYGQTIWPDTHVTGIDGASVEPGTLVEVNRRSLLRAAAVDLETIVSDVPVVDYMHLDIQGSELDVLATAPELLRERVRIVDVSTHSEPIERDLRRLFTSMGWRCRADIPMRTTVLLCSDAGAPVPVPFVDGHQVWVNGRL